jgi:D-alanine-D-alanine ligase
MSRPQRVAVVWNRSKDGVLFRGPRPSPERYGRRTIERVLTALSQRFEEVACLEGDRTLLDALGDFLQATGDDAPSPGIVLNLAYGVQGDGRYTHVPSMLEMAGVPYTGAGPLGHAVSLDKVTAKTLVQAVGIRTPAWRTARRPAPGIADGLPFPLIVKPRHELTSHGVRLVRDEAELNAAIAATVTGFRQEALIEQYIDGREICIGLLGNGHPEVLPAVELDFGGRDLQLVSTDDKYHRRDDEPTKLCPAPVEPEILADAEQAALDTFAACHCRDYARVDIRLDDDGRPWVLEVNSMASLGAGGSYVRSASQAGIRFESLLERIVNIAWARHLRTASGSVSFPPLPSTHRVSRALAAQGPALIADGLHAHG